MTPAALGGHRSLWANAAPLGFVWSTDPLCIPAARSRRHRPWPRRPTSTQDRTGPLLARVQQVSPSVVGARRIALAASGPPRSAAFGGRDRRMRWPFRSGPVPATLAFVRRRSSSQDRSLAASPDPLRGAQPIPLRRLAPTASRRGRRCPRRACAAVIRSGQRGNSIASSRRASDSSTVPEWFPHSSVSRIHSARTARLGTSSSSATGWSFAGVPEVWGSTRRTLRTRRSRLSSSSCATCRSAGSTVLAAGCAAKRWQSCEYG